MPFYFVVGVVCGGGLVSYGQHGDHQGSRAITHVIKLRHGVEQLKALEALLPWEVMRAKSLQTRSAHTVLPSFSS